MYSNVYELPTQVKASLSHEDCEKWMDAYNKLNPTTESMARSAYREAWRACRELPSSFAFDTIASTETIDKANDLIDLDSIKETFDPYIDFGGNIQLDHRNYTVGTIWDWEPTMVDTEDGRVPGILAHGNLFGGDFVYDTVRKHFVDGMSSLSIGGEATRGDRLCDEKGCYTKKELKQLLEVSVCSEPMNKYTNLVWYNKGASLTKSRSAYEDRCPILSLKRKLCDAGMDAHAKEDGVYVAMTRSEFASMEPVFGDNGIKSFYDGANARLAWLDPIERSDRLYKDLMDKINKNGKIDIAVDFDQTLFDYDMGPNYELIDLLKRLEPVSNVFIWTCRDDEDKEFIIDKLEELGLSFTGMNTPIQESKSSRKAYADVYVDDKSGLDEVMSVLEKIAGGQ